MSDAAQHQYAQVSSPDGQGTILADTRTAPQAPPTDAVVTPPAAQVVQAPEVIEAPSSAFDQAIDETKLKFLELADGRRYRALDKMPARSLAKMMRALSQLQGLTATKDISKIAVTFEDAIEMAMSMIHPDDEARLDADLDDKVNQVEFNDLLNAVVKLVPAYTGSSTPKA